jgi:predicted aminopeptidase
MPGRDRLRTARFLTVGVCLLLTAGGCGLDWEYILPVAAGQLDILLNSIPVEDALDSGLLSADEEAKLRLVVEVREFAGDEIGLNIVDNYDTFYDTGDRPTAYNVSACAKHEFVPVEWTFPFVGTVPYLGFFHWDLAEDKINKLSERGYDVWYYEVSAYATLEYLPNPVFSFMLRRDELSLADVVIHELLHNTIWHESTVFSESLATFVGRTGALDFFRTRYAEDSDFMQTALQRYEDTDRYNAFLVELYDELDAFYSQDLSVQERVDRREAVYQAGRDRFVEEVLPLMHRAGSFDPAADLPTNNAWMLANVRYNTDLDVFQQVHEATGHNWWMSLSIFREAANHADPYAYLETWVTENGPALTDSASPESDSAPPAASAKRAAEPEAQPPVGGPCRRPPPIKYPF